MHTKGIKREITITLGVATVFYLVAMLFIGAGLAEESERIKTYGLDADPTPYWEAMLFWTCVGVAFPVTATVMVRNQEVGSQKWHIPITLWGLWIVAMGLCLSLI